MTVNNQTIEVFYNGDGTQTDFPITFDILDTTQVKWMPVGGDVVETSLGSKQWVVRFNSAPTGEVHIYRETPITQELNFKPYDAFPAEAHEGALDKLTEICQELEDDKLNQDDGDGRYLQLTGGEMQGVIDMKGNGITHLHDPIADMDAVNKRWYKKNQIPGIQGEIGPVGPPPEVTADANTVPWEEGADVTVTPDSDPYTGVHLEFQIPEGPVGVTPEFSADATTIPPDEDASVIVTQTGPPDAHAVNLDFQIPQGIRGEKGEGIDFMGSVATLDDLPSDANKGEAWWVESESGLYVWGGDTKKWEDLGDIRGPKGDEGDGWKSGTFNSADNKVTFTGQDWSPQLTFTTDSLKGDKGDAGTDAYNPTVGSVTTETKPDGTDAEVSVAANGDGNFDFDFKIPRGHSPSVNSVSTATGAAGSDANVLVTSTPDYDLNFNFTIPRGDTGLTGPQGISHYDYGTVVDTTVTGFSTLSTKPTSVMNGTFYEFTMSNTKAVGAIQLKSTSPMTPFFSMRLSDFDLGHTLVVVLDATSGNELSMIMRISDVGNVYGPKGEIPNTPAGEIAVYALTRTAMGLFVNMTSSFEAVS